LLFIVTAQVRSIGGLLLNTPGIPLIHIIDDDESFRGALARLLRAAGYQVETYSSAGEFFLIGPKDGPGCLLLDLKMPGCNGLDLQTALAGREQSLPIIFISGHGNIPAAVRALKAGALDFLTKPVRKQLLLEVVKQAIIRDAERRAHYARLSLLRSRYETLTRRESEVFGQVIVGKLNKQIAADIGATERTVKAHRARVMEKMRVTSVAELVHIADQLVAPMP
jgi:FixJ family two-component response regulator